MLVCVLPQLSVVGYVLILVFEAGKVVMGLVLLPQQYLKLHEYTAFIIY